MSATDYDNLMGRDVVVLADGFTGRVYARKGGPIPTYRVQIGGRDLGREYRPSELRRIDDPDRVVVRLP